MVKAPSSIKDGKRAFRYAIFYNRAMVYAWSFRGWYCTFRKKAKAREVIFALIKSRGFHHDHIQYLSDSSKDVSAIEGREDWSLRNFVVDMLELSKSFASLKLKHVSRTLNVATHSLIKFCINFNVDVEFFYSFLDWLDDQFIWGNVLCVCVVFLLF